MSTINVLSQLAAVCLLAAGEIGDVRPVDTQRRRNQGHPSNLGNASPEEVAKIREETKRRKELNFRKRLPKGHPDRIES